MGPLGSLIADDGGEERPSWDRRSCGVAAVGTTRRWGVGGGGAQPWGRPEGDPILTPNPTGAVRSFGSAKARYDFCARDRTELTLREGDIIRVLSKKGHPGWWKGEIYGRVRPLPKPHRPPLPNPTIAPHGSPRILPPLGRMVPR